MRLASLDLNLLVQLDALLRERNVTRAAERLGLSQPTLSAALGRLRRHFGDELLLRTGNSYVLTPLAEELLERTAVAMSGVENVFDARLRFDPAGCRREFRVYTSDYAMNVFAPAFSRALSRQAPQASIRFTSHSPRIVEAAAEHLRVADALLLPHGFVSGLPHRDVYTDRWVCLVSAGNDEVGEELTEQHLRTLPWVLAYHEPTAYSPAARQMQLLGIEPVVDVVTDSFLPVPGLVSGTRRVALVQERLASQVPAALELRVLPAPFEALPLVEAMWWHPVSSPDPEHQLLRRVAAEASAELRRLEAGDVGVSDAGEAGDAGEGAVEPQPLARA